MFFFKLISWIKFEEKKMSNRALKAIVMLICIIFFIITVDNKNFHLSIFFLQIIIEKSKLFLFFCLVTYRVVVWIF